MHKALLLTLTVGLALGSSVIAKAQPQGLEKSPPNFIVIFADDLGYGDLGCFGNTVHRTPHIDRLAEQGLRLTSFYGAPCCSPSRAQLMTGCYARRVGLNDGPQVWVILPKDPIGLNPEETTLPEILKTRGYCTACIGKWHLGDQPPFMPTRHGFDEYFGLPYSNDMWPPFNESDDPRMIAAKERFNHAPLPLIRGEKVLQAVEDQSVLTEQYTEEAIGFIRRNAEHTFFLYMPHTAVHAPLYPGKKFLGKSANGRYGDWVEEVDSSVGRIVETLNELGLAENTLILFTSDNGASRLWGGTNVPLSGFKGSVQEGGIRVPCIVRWPNRIPAGSTTDQVATVMDLLPTFAALSGARLPGDRIIDGRDISKLLTAPATASSPHEAFYYFTRRELVAVRSGPWKLYLRGGRLYHLGQDVAEKDNVASENAVVVQRLERFADRMRRDLGDGSEEFPGVNQREPGRVENPRRLIAHDGTIAEDVR
jgi:arylsulfatase A-like enzyme